MTTIFVPTRFKDRVAAMPEITHVASEEILGHCRTIPVWGYLMEVSHDADVRKLFSIRNCYDSFTTEGKTAALFVAPLTKKERSQRKGMVHLDIDSASESHRTLVYASFEHLIKFLEPISVSLNCQVTLHITDRPAFEPFYEDDHIHVVLSSRPPGKSYKQKPFVLDKILLDGTSCPGPTEGRGFEVQYDDDFVIGQIVGSTIYLFLPMGKAAISSFSHDHDNPFRIALATVWHEYLTMQKEILIPEAQIDSYDSFAANVSQDSIATMMREAQREEIQKLHKEAERLVRELALVHAQLKANVALMKAIELTPIVVDLPPLWEQLQHNSSIECITLSHDKVLHYHTAAVYIEDDDGNLRDVGSFTIRVGDFDVYIWSTRITHPERISHPHIQSSENSICLGNISTEVAKLCAENRKVEAVLLCLRWLTEGYEPSLTYHRVEEWPLVGTQKVAKEKIDA